MKKLLIVLVLSLFGGTVPVLLFWIQQHFVTGLNPYLGTVVIIVVLVILLVLVAFVKKLRNRWIGNNRFSPVLLFATGCISFSIAGVLTYTYFGNTTLDIHLPDTLFVIARINWLIIGSFIFGWLAFFYYCIPRIIGRPLNGIMAYLHFWISFIGGYLVVWPFHFGNLAGMPRRYFDNSLMNSFRRFETFNRFLSTVVILVFAAQLLFVFNIIYSLLKGRRVRI